MKLVTKYLLLITTLTLTSCAGLERYSAHTTYNPPEEPQPSVIDKLESCTEKYINKLGVNPKEAYVICNSIYRR